MDGFIEGVKVIFSFIWDNLIYINMVFAILVVFYMDGVRTNAEIARLIAADMGIDSLDFVDIVVIVERNFGFKIKAEEMVGVDTFSKFCDYIESKLN